MTQTAPENKPLPTTKKKAAKPAKSDAKIAEEAREGAAEDAKVANAYNVKNHYDAEAHKVFDSIMEDEDKKKQIATEQKMKKNDLKARGYTIRAINQEIANRKKAADVVQFQKDEHLTFHVAITPADQLTLFDQNEHKRLVTEQSEGAEDPAVVAAKLGGSSDTKH